MKTLKYLSMMLMAFVMAFGMAACGSDSSNEEEGGGGGGGSTSGVVGTWYQDVSDQVTGYVDKAYTIVTFKENGTSIAQELMYVYGYWVKTTVATSTYKVEGNKIISETGSVTWTRNGDKLIVDGETWYKITSEIQKNLNNAMDSDDYQ